MPPELDLKWDESNAHELRAQVCQVRSTREETTLLFGTSMPDEGGQPRARLDRCIVMSPALAKQLAAALAEAAQVHEQRSGGLNATPAGLFETPSAPVEVPAEARPMLQLVQGLGAGFGFEKSLKLSETGALGDRLILGVRTRRADPRALLEVCRAIGMPSSHLAQLEERLPQANTIGFGFEGGKDGGFFKVYLEFWDLLWQRLQREPRNVEPALLFLGFKWSARDSAQCTVARYTCYPLLSIEGISRRLAALYEGRAECPSLDAAREILQLAATYRPGDSFVYVEAAEEGNPRRSFDINFYKAGLRMRDLGPCLAALSARYAISPSDLDAVSAPALAQPFGHLSGGLGRDGRDFLTVYYEIEAL